MSEAHGNHPVTATSDAPGGEEVRSRRASLDHAAVLFMSLAEAHGYDRLEFAVGDERIPLPLMVDPQAWLSPWMLRSDEYATLFSGRRIWDAGYQADYSCVEGLRARPLVEFSGDPIAESYRDVPLASEAEVPPPLGALLCLHAIATSVEIDRNLAALKPITGFYEIDGSLSDGDLLPFPGPDLLSVAELSRFTAEAVPRVKALIEQAPGPRNEPHGGV